MKLQPTQIIVATSPDQITSVTSVEARPGITLSIGPTQLLAITSAQLSGFADMRAWGAVYKQQARKSKNNRRACTQVEMTRALRAAKQVGGVTVEITRDGAIRFEPSTAPEKSLAPRVDRKRDIVL